MKICLDICLQTLSVPRSEISLRTKLSEHIFKVKLFIILIFLQHAGSASLSYVDQLIVKNVYSVWSRIFGIFWYRFIDQQLNISSSVTKANHSPISRLTLIQIANLKLWSFGNWGISLGDNITWIFPRFSWGIFGHMRCLDQLRASENIWCPDYKIFIQDVHMHSWASQQEKHNQLNWIKLYLSLKIPL